MASAWMGLRSKFINSSYKHSQEPGEGIEVAINDALLERDDGIVGNGDAFGADFGAALGDVAIADTVLLAEVGEAVIGVERVHFECRGIDEEARADEFAVLVVVAEHVANVLAEEALDTFAEFLHAIG